ncbi:50S ribosomal protein L21, chloroplastic-like [Gossypium australe]|uniref:50S ribosomal protein L21, chloroplastic-like n=1 Tax=Gossypium australe TaxID=47621 RepID=A0A5B6UBL7_9ROSI|nr:50S ribosomal protein L21, chloroplastic-like [Gossypium australe]
MPMASSATFSTLVLSSSFATQCNVSNRHHQSCFLSSPPKTPIFSIPKPVSLKLTSPPLLSKTPTFFTIPKSSESGAAVVDVEPDNVAPEPEPEAAPEPEPGPASVVEASKEEPKREEIFAVVMIGGRQYIVFPGRYLYTQRLKGANVNDKITVMEGTELVLGIWVLLIKIVIIVLELCCDLKIVLNKVLLVGTKTTTYIGKPVVTNAAVHAVVEEQGLNPKVVVFKYKKKKNYRRNIGHRQVRLFGLKIDCCLHAICRLYPARGVTDFELVASIAAESMQHTFDDLLLQPNTRIRITGITGYQDYPAVTLES